MSNFLTGWMITLILKNADDWAEGALSKSKLKELFVKIQNDAPFAEVLDWYLDTFRPELNIDVMSWAAKSAIILQEIDEVLTSLKNTPVKEQIKSLCGDAVIPETQISLADFVLDIIKDTAEGEDGVEPS